MTFEGAAAARTLEGAMQTIARGPVAAMVAIKQLGTNGGGFFGPNSTHPFENPSFLTNYIECISIPLIAMATVWMFGRITGRMRHAAVIFSVMLLLLILKSGIALNLESAPAMAFKGLPIETVSNLEGKELRFGPSGTAAMWAAVTTATSNGSVNCMHDSLNPLTGLVPLAGMWLNVIFGGVGVGFINMFIFIIVGVFICGMMVGRTPEYCARKVETHEMKLALLALLVHPLLILVGTALFASSTWGAGTVLNKGAHGFSEILYEFSSAAANNGSGFEGLVDGTVPWNVATGLVMVLGRFIPIILPLAIAGSMAAKKPVPETTGTLRIDTPLFAVVILGSVWRLVVSKLPVSISIGLWTFFITYLVSIPLGIAKAVRDGSRFDAVTSSMILVGYAIPGFVLGVLLLVLFGGGSFLQIFPLRGLTSDDWSDFSLMGKVLDYLWHLVLPITASVLGSFAVVTMLTKNSFLEKSLNTQLLVTQLKRA